MDGTWLLLTESDVPLSFLGSGQWTAETYADGAGRELTFGTRTVTAGGTLSLPVSKDGGFVVKFMQPASPHVA